MGIQKNIEEYNKAKNLVIEHCMCFDIKIDDQFAIIIYPEGDFVVDGIKTYNTKKGLTKALKIMEQHWLENLP